MQTVVKYPNRILTHQESEERFLTGENNNLVVDYFMTWRISDPAQYYARVRTELAAVGRMTAVSSVRGLRRRSSLPSEGVTVNSLAACDEQKDMVMISVNPDALMAPATPRIRL